jgi:hypothetical protein
MSPIALVVIAVLFSIVFCWLWVLTRVSSSLIAEREERE